MSRKNKPTKQAPQRPAYHIFNDPRLNTLFCRTKEDALVFAEGASKHFLDFMMKGIEDIDLFDTEKAARHMRTKAVAYHAAVLETAFDLGWCECLQHMADSSSVVRCPLSKVSGKGGER